MTSEVFGVLQEYLYTDRIQSLVSVDQLALIAVANRLCLPRLVSLVEDYVVGELGHAAEEDEDILEEVLMLIEPAQVTAVAQHYGLPMCVLEYSVRQQKHKYRGDYSGLLMMFLILIDF